MISITGMWVALAIIAVLTVAAVVAVILALRDRALTGDEEAAAAFIHDMHEANTGGLMALPAPGTTVKIPPRDRRAAARTLVNHEPPQTSGPAVPVIAAGPEHQPPAAATPCSPPAAAGPEVAGREGAEVAAAMDAPEPRPAGDLAAMTFDEYEDYINSIGWKAYVTAEFPAIRDDATAGA